MDERPKPTPERPYQILVRTMRERGKINSENIGRGLRGEPIKQWDWKAGAPAPLPDHPRRRSGKR